MSRVVKIKTIILLVIFFITSGFAIPQKTAAKADNYPKLANYYLAWDVSDDEVKQLAKWDIVILSPQALERNPQVITNLKKYNPQVKVLVYVLSQEINVNPQIISASPYYQKIYNIVSQNNWWVRTADGQTVNWWPNTQMINAASVAPRTSQGIWSEYLPQLVNQEFLQGQWDGVFYDNIWHNIDWLKQPIDLDANKVADSPTYMNDKWRAGLTNIITQTKKLAPNKLVVANTNTNFYNNNLNGRMQENWPASNEGAWTGNLQNYLNPNFGHNPKYFIINANTKNTGLKEDYSSFRFGLTSTLLGEGYFSFDHGDQAHESLWWYDEYNFFLGKSVSGITNLLDPASKEIKSGVWQRDFQNALILVNSTNTVQKIKLDEEFEKIKGNQDKKTNSGSVIKSVTLKPNDGIILLRRIADIKNSPYFNGSFARVFNKYGDAVRNGFFVYEKQYKGGDVVAKYDLDNNGLLEIIVADKRKITIYDQNKNVIRTFYPYGQNYNHGINFSINDFENDGYFEIITGTMRGFSPLVKVFNYKGEEQGPGFHAYASDYKGGVNVAVCDTNGNGQKEIVTGAGYMGGPQVRIFDKNGKVLSGGFFAYAKNFRGGVNVACGDIDGNGIDEIVTGAGFGGSSHVRYFNSKFEPLSPGFWAFGKESRTGVRIIVNDLDNDGIAEILAASPDTFTTAFK